MQQLNPSEISDIIKQRIARLDVTSEARNEGTIVSVSDGIVRAEHTYLWQLYNCSRLPCPPLIPASAKSYFTAVAVG